MLGSMQWATMREVKVRIDEDTYSKLLHIANTLGLDVEDFVQKLVKLSADLAYLGLVSELGEPQAPGQTHPSN